MRFAGSGLRAYSLESTGLKLSALLCFYLNYAMAAGRGLVSRTSQQLSVLGSSLTYESADADLGLLRERLAGLES